MRAITVVARRATTQAQHLALKPHTLLEMPIEQGVAKPEVLGLWRQELGR